MKDKILESLSKAWAFVKEYWYIFVSGAAALFSFIFYRGKVKALMNTFISNQRNQIETSKKVDDIREDEIVERDAIDKEMEKSIEAIEEHEKQRRQLSDKQKEKRKEHLESKTTEEVAEELKKEFKL